MVRRQRQVRFVCQRHALAARTPSRAAVHAHVLRRVAASLHPAVPKQHSVVSQRPIVPEDVKGQAQARKH